MDGKTKVQSAGDFSPEAAGATQAIDLGTFDTFRVHPWIADLSRRYRKDSALSKFALLRIIEDLKKIDEGYRAKHGRALLTTIEGRVKKENSFFRKVFRVCQDQAR